MALFCATISRYYVFLLKFHFRSYVDTLLVSNLATLKLEISIPLLYFLFLFPSIAFLSAFMFLVRLLAAVNSLCNVVFHSLS